jgi:hypothetical protein
MRGSQRSTRSTAPQGTETANETNTLKPMKPLQKISELVKSGSQSKSGGSFRDELTQRKRKAPSEVLDGGDTTTDGEDFIVSPVPVKRTKVRLFSPASYYSGIC